MLVIKTEGVWRAWDSWLLDMEAEATAPDYSWTQESPDFAQDEAEGNKKQLSSSI